MKYEVNRIYHKYIIKLVIFSIFLYKKQIRQPNLYKLSVISYINKRVPWKINLKIDTGILLDKEDERDVILENILNDVESDYLSIVNATFVTPIKAMNIRIDINDEDRYEEYIYN